MLWNKVHQALSTAYRKETFFSPNFNLTQLLMMNILWNFLPYMETFYMKNTRKQTLEGQTSI